MHLEQSPEGVFVQGPQQMRWPLLLQPRGGLPRHGTFI